MYSHEAEHHTPCDNTVQTIQPQAGPTASQLTLLVADLSPWIPGDPPPAGGSPNTIMVNTHAQFGEPSTGLISMNDAVNFANNDGMATRIVFDPLVFSSSAAPLETDAPLQLLSDYDEIDGSGAHVVLQPADNASDRRCGVALVGGNTVLRNLNIQGYDVAGVVAAGPMSSPEIVDTTISGCGIHGVAVMPGADALVKDSTITDSGDDGVRVEGSSATVSGCSILDSGKHGVCALNAHLRLEGATVSGTGGLGLYFGGEQPGIFELPDAKASSSCLNDILGGNQFDPNPQMGWFVSPQAQMQFDELLPPNIDPPDYLDTSQPVAFYLPFENGADVKIGQGYNNPDGTHACSISLDLTIEDGTPIASVARGRVIRTLNYIDGPAASKAGNTVWIDHGHGIIGRYTHLAKDSIAVEPGQFIERYTYIADGSSTGNSTGPHLHLGFSKFRSRRVWPEMFPNPADHTCGDDPAWWIEFEDVPGGIPYAGQKDDNDVCMNGADQDGKCLPYVSGNGPDNDPPPFEDSVFARDLFLDRDGGGRQNDYDNGNGVIELTRKVPMAYYETDTEYLFSGNAPVGAAAIVVAVQDYVTREIIETVVGLVDSNGRFNIGVTFCEAGPYWLTLEATSSTDNNGEWVFHYDAGDFYPIIVAGGNPLVETPPYYDRRVLCSPKLDFDCDGIANEDDPDIDGDNVPNDQDAWRDIQITTTGEGDSGNCNWGLAAAMGAANVDCMRTRITFHPGLFDEDNPLAITLDDDLRTGTDGDMIDGTGAGVIIRAADGDVSRALTLIGTQGMTIKNVQFEDFAHSTASVSYQTKAWFNGVDIYQGVGGDSSPLTVNTEATAQFKNGEIHAVADQPVVLLREDSSLVMSDTLLFGGRDGVWTRKDARFTLCDVNIDSAYGNGLILDHSGPCEANNVSVFFSSDGVDLKGDSTLVLRNSNFGAVDRGIVLRHDAQLKVCNTTSSIGPQGFWLDDNQVTDWTNQPLKVYDNAAIIGGTCTQPTCGIKLNAKVAGGGIAPPIMNEPLGFDSGG